MRVKESKKGHGDTSNNAAVFIRSENILTCMLICLCLFSGCTNDKDNSNSDTGLGNAVDIDVDIEAEKKGDTRIFQMYVRFLSISL